MPLSIGTSTTGAFVSATDMVRLDSAVPLVLPRTFRRAEVPGQLAELPRPRIHDDHGGGARWPGTG